ncbi:SDR family oxidoreductase [Limosilactobacillus pontis]|nr:SDR family oxidoreductase [Limosilactobacillus pontis]MDM8332821.1 SDR family oxidoreductase [Limosilactobacillus pontis]
MRLLTKTAALDAATHRWGIRVNAVFPGVIDTGILTPDELKQFDGITPLGRVGKPKDIAPICAYLGSDESLFAAGADFVIDGGYTAQ